MKQLTIPGIALLLTCSTAVLAQTSGELKPLVEKIEVTVVNVDVTVTDKDGKPASGLTKDDFEILEDGKSQAVTGFYTIESSSVRLSSDEKAESVATDTEQFRRRVILMVDSNTAGVRERNAALDDVQKFIDESFKGNYEWSVVSIGATVDTIQGFTSDKEAIRKAIASVKKQPSFESQREIDRRIISDPLYKWFQDISDSVGGGYDVNENMRFSGQEATLRNLHSTIKTAGAFVQTCRAYSNLSGKKLVVLITGGIETNTDLEQFKSSSKDPPSSMDRNIDEMKREQAQILDMMVREANAANFNIYVVNAKGLGLLSPAYDVTNRSLGVGGSTQQISKQQESQTRPVDLTDVRSTSLTLALGTGGMYLQGNDVLLSMRTVEEQAANYYSLAYRPPTPGDGKYHRVAVRMKKPGLSVHYGDSYTGLSSNMRFEQALRAPMSFPKEKGNLPVELSIGVPGTSQGERSTPVTVSMPMERVTMFPKGDSYVGRIHVYTTVYDASGLNVAFQHHVQDLSVPLKQIPLIKGKPFRYTQKVTLKKGTYTVAVTLRDDLSNDFGTTITELKI